MSVEAVLGSFAPADAAGNVQSLELTAFDAGLAGVDAGATRLTIPLACTTCRSRHLKCDGQRPCSRCATDQVDCTYVKSRRGYKGPRKVKTSDNAEGPKIAPATKRKDSQVSSSSSQATKRSNTAASLTPPSTVNSDVYIPPVTPVEPGSLLSSPPITSSPYSDAEVANALTATTLPSQLSGEQWPGSLFFNSYYENFHPCHPFLLPRRHMLHLIQTTNLPHLVVAIQFIGSFYHPSASTMIALDVVRDLLKQTATRDGYYVQAMILLTIGLQMAARPEQASPALASTSQLAVSIGLHRRDYAWVHGHNSVVHEECWRRTWWELYVLNGMLAAMNRAPFTLYDIEADCLLPCEEWEYESGTIPPPKSFEDIDEADFLLEDQVFSSFAYRADISRRSGFAIKAALMESLSFETLELADAVLANWSLQLPASKRDPIDADGNIDEMMFQAHMLAAACGVMINRPRSDLNVDDVINIRTCVAGSMCTLAGERRHVYTAKALANAQSVSRLMLLPYPLQKHSPFFSCITTMAVVVFLSYWSLCAIDGSDTATKEQIKLSLGTLKSLSEIWPIAGRVYGQVKMVAQELYAARKAINSSNWAAITGGEILPGLLGEVDSTSSTSSSQHGTSVAGN